MKTVITNLRKFINKKVEIIYTWKTTKMRSLFCVKDKVCHPSNVIFKMNALAKQSTLGKLPEMLKQDGRSIIVIQGDLSLQNILSKTQTIRLLGKSLAKPRHLQGKGRFSKRIL